MFATIKTQCRSQIFIMWEMESPYESLIDLKAPDNVVVKMCASDPNCGDKLHSERLPQTQSCCDYVVRRVDGNERRLNNRMT